MRARNRVRSINAALAHDWVLIIILIKLIHLILSIVQVMEQDPDGTSSKETSNRQPSKHPHDRGVVQQRIQRLGNGGAKGVGEEVHGLDEGLHRRRRLGVGVLETGDGCEDLGDTDEHIRTGLRGNVDVVTLDGAGGVLGGIAQRLTVTWTGCVDVVLNDGGVDHGEGRDPETTGDTIDGGESDVALAQERHEELVDKRQENDDGDGIEVLHKIVGDTVTSHLTGLSDKVVGEVTVHDPVDWVEAEDLASDEGTLDLIDKVVVPLGNGVVSEAGLVGRLCSVHLTVLDHHPDNTESVGDDGALRRAHNVDLTSKHEDERADEEHAQAQKVGGPEIGVQLHIRSGDQGKGTGVDAEVEDHVNPLDGDRGVDDDALASLLVGANNHLSPLVLIGDEGSNIRLDTTSSKTDDNDSENESRHTGAVVQCGRKRCQCQDEKTNDVNTAEDHDGVVLSEVLISDNGTKNRSDIAPELEERRETGSTLVSKTKRTATKRSIVRARDVVLEETGSTVVGETLAEFDNGNQEGRFGERLANLAEGLEFLACGPDATKTIVVGVVVLAEGVVGVALDDLLVVCHDVGTDIVVVQRCAEEMRLVVSLCLHVLQLLSAGSLLGTLSKMNSH
jgi:hypothetical protein